MFSIHVGRVLNRKKQQALPDLLLLIFGYSPEIILLPEECPV
jgi:hypothetical protein